MNRDYLLEQFKLMEEYIGRARSIASRPENEFLADFVLIDAAVRQLTVLFETAHNISKHIIAENEWREASSKAEAFEILAEQGVLPEEVCDAFRQASHFRNLVTYQTAMIDNRIVYRILTERIGDFETLVAHIAGWLKERDTDDAQDPT